MVMKYDKIGYLPKFYIPKMTTGLTKMGTMTPIPTQFTPFCFPFDDMIMKHDCVTHI